jgi:hypothetical protein
MSSTTPGQKWSISDVLHRALVLTPKAARTLLLAAGECVLPFEVAGLHLEEPTQEVAEAAWVRSVGVLEVCSEVFDLDGHAGLVDRTVLGLTT